MCQVFFYRYLAYLYRQITRQHENNISDIADVGMHVCINVG